MDVMNNLMQAKDPIENETTLDKSGLSRGEGPMSHRGEASSQTLGREFREVINKGNRSKLRDELSTLNFRDKGNNRIVESGYVYCPQTVSLNDVTDEILKMRPKLFKEGDGKAIRARGRIRIRFFNRGEDLLFRVRDHQNRIFIRGDQSPLVPEIRR